MCVCVAFNNDQIRRLLINSNMMHNLASKVFRTTFESQWPNICHKLSQDNGVQVHEYKSRYQDCSKFTLSIVVLFDTVSPFLCCEIHLSCCNASVRRHEEAGPTERDALKYNRYVMVTYTPPMTLYGVAESTEHKRTAKVRFGYQGMLERTFYHNKQRQEHQEHKGNKKTCKKSTSRHGSQPPLVTSSWKLGHMQSNHNLGHSHMGTM